MITQKNNDKQKRKKEMSLIKSWQTQKNKII